VKLGRNDVKRGKLVVQDAINDKTVTQELVKLVIYLLYRNPHLLSMYFILFTNYKTLCHSDNDSQET
jgi:hypothetical protein